jgi:hypothetical protein
MASRAREVPRVNRFIAEVEAARNSARHGELSAWLSGAVSAGPSEYRPNIDGHFPAVMARSSRALRRHIFETYCAPAIANRGRIIRYAGF